MTRRRWIADEAAGERAVLLGEHAVHLARVLRARIGQEFEIAWEGRVRLGRVTSVTEARVEFDLGADVPQSAGRAVVLLLSIFKFDRMEWAIEKSTELGVSRIIPVAARRSDAHLVAAAEKRVERWQRIVLQASEQARRTSPPEISAPVLLKQAIRLDSPVKIMLAETEQITSLSQVLESADSEGEIALAIGPEGGWTEDEIRAFDEAAWQQVSLGRNILRAETAAIAALAVVRAKEQ
ncbi:MAG TPA: RsmE family RNA methyltransferase [Terriglobales bacterium]|nr:RsmE family RNA methyltransferase [Terriglobales bacterium]